VLVDVVDGFPVPGLEEHVDAFLCASRSELEHRLSIGHAAVEVLHQVDTRFDPQPFVRSNFIVGYLGGTDGSAHLSEISNISTHFTRLSMSDREARNASRAATRWSHHYSVRSYFGESNFKPPTKVFLAARLGSVFIGSRADEEVALLLGSDYPYLSKDSSYEEVRKIIEFAQESFLDKDWVRAKSAMEDARQECCDDAIAERLLSILAGLD
jgi:hypothetical protein